MTFDYIGNLAQLERRSDYRDAGEILGRRDGKDVTYIKSLVRRIDNPPVPGVDESDRSAAMTTRLHPPS